MSVIPKLATSLNRRDEVPNQELAEEIVRSEDKAAVGELVENLKNKDKGIRYDCIKAIYEVGYRKPYLIADHLPVFLGLLENKDNRLQWGAMTALGCIAREKPAEIFASLGRIVEAAEKGSVITRDHCVKILVSLSELEEYADKSFPLLLEQIMKSPANQFPMYAENALPAITALNKDRFIDALTGRIEDIERESGRKRVEKVIKKAGKISR
jgi:hypothetical protein